MSHVDRLCSMVHRFEQNKWCLFEGAHAVYVYAWKDQTSLEYKLSSL
jgi:hypothetical protein